MAHPKVLEAAVIAVPHPKWMERPLACVVPRPGAHLDAAEIIEFLRPQLARWALPDEVVFLEEVPKTSVGKFDKKVLRERFKDWSPPSQCSNAPAAALSARLTLTVGQRLSTVAPSLQCGYRLRTAHSTWRSYDEQVTRRQFVATTGTGLAGILATRIPPARGQQREISYLCWNNFAPNSDKKLAEIGQRFTKDTGIKIKIDHIAARPAGRQVRLPRCRARPATT